MIFDPTLPRIILFSGIYNVSVLLFIFLCVTKLYVFTRSTCVIFDDTLPRLTLFSGIMCHSSLD